MYIIRDREYGNIIDYADTMEEALKVVEGFENEDKAESNYFSGFYEIVKED